MRCYLSFSDKEVFKGEVLPEEMSAIPIEGADTQTTMIPTGTPEEGATGEPLGNQLQRGGPQSSLVGRRYYTLPDQWWLLGRFPSHRKAQD